MFCPQCGKPLAEGARFCGNCGAAVATATGAPPPEPTPAPAAAAVPPRAEPPRPEPPPSAGAVPPAGDVVHGLVERVKGILIAPRTEWPAIAAEPRTARDIYLGYVAPLAAIGVIASFIGATTIGVPVPLLGTVRTPIVPAVVGALLHYALTFAGVFVVALIVDTLAPTFGGQKDPVRALKVTAYSFTAAWIAGVLTIIPMLGIVAFLASLYGLYLLYLGLPVLMRSPPDKAVGYTIVVVICAIVLFFIISLLTAGLLALFGMGSANVISRAPATQNRDTEVAAAIASKLLGGESAADQARVKDAITKLQKTGDQANNHPGAVDVNAAMNAVGTLMAGGKDVQPVDFHALKDMLPASLPGLARTDASGQSGEAMGMKGSSANATYSDGASASVTLEIADLGSLSGLASLATRFDPKLEKETATGYERTRNLSGQLVHEQFDRQSRSGETTVLIGNRFAVTVRGRGVDAGQLTGALQAVDLARLPKLAAK
jgi:hypothetical protein